MFSTKASGTWHQSLFVSSHFTAEAPFATRVLNIAQAVLASTFLFLPPSAPILWTMSLRSLSVLPKSWQVLACASAGGASAAAAAPASARRARSATGRRYRERGMVWSSLRRVCVEALESRRFHHRIVAALALPRRNGRAGLRRLRAARP